MKQLLINSEALETRVAVVENGKMQEYFVERKGRCGLVGSIFKARINNLEPSLQAAFVNIGAAKNAFLHYWDMLPATQEMLEAEEEQQKPEVQDRPKRNRSPRNSRKSAKKPEPPKGLFSRIKEKILVGKKEAVEKEERSNQRSRQQRRPRGQRQQNRRRKPKRSAFTVEDIPNLFQEGSEVLVQVTKGPIGTKGARVTTNLSIPGRYLVLLPNSNHVGVSKRIEDVAERKRLRDILRRMKLPPKMGIICRTVGAGKKEQFFERDLEMLLKCWEDIENGIKNEKAPYCVYQEPFLIERALRDFLTEEVDEIVADSKEAYDQAQEMVRNLSRQERVKIRYYNNPRPIFEKHRLVDQIQTIYGRKVPLPSGGYLCFDETEALIAIDVNSGKSRGGKDHPETILNTNLEAVQEIARQLRLRNVGGLIVCDLIDMRSRQDQQTVYRTFKEALLADRAKTKTLPISSLGLVEMTRQREQESLKDRLYTPCPYCNSKGVVKSPTTISVEIQRRLQELIRRERGIAKFKVSVHPMVLERLKNEDAELIHALEGEHGGELSFRSDPALHMEEFHVNDLETGAER